MLLCFGQLHIILSFSSVAKMEAVGMLEVWSNEKSPLIEYYSEIENLWPFLLLQIRPTDSHSAIFGIVESNLIRHPI